MIVAASWDGASLSPAAREVVAAASSLGGELDAETAYVSLGGREAAAESAAYGASRAFAFEGDLAASGAEGALAALAELARELEARAVLLPADERSAELAPRLAGRLGGAAVLNATGLVVREGRPVWTRPVFGGKAVAELAVVAGPAVATLRRGVVETPDAGVATTAVETRAAPDAGDAVELLGRDEPAAGASLEDAKVIVAGGAGLGDAAAFAELEELARLLGGVVGASLAAVDAGWAPPDRQVGLTGKSVAPDVYFALGISGASQHLAGIGDAKAVVAVNTDAGAPIFSRATLGAVIDCRALVAALMDELRRRSS